MIFAVSFITLVAGGLFVALNLPQLGANPAGKRLERLKQSRYYRRGRFFNTEKTRLNMGPKEMLKSLWEYYTDPGRGKRVPAKPLVPVKLDIESLTGKRTDEVALTWFGHSTFLLEFEGKILFLDPMLDATASPFAFMGARRFSSDLPVNAEDLPDIDAVIISHDHYDHLDYTSILQLKDKVGHFFMPLGVGAHLEHWGVDPAKITEMDWWESVDFAGLELVATPSRHFSGRFFQRYNTLWASWVIRGKTKNLFFGADSGYFKGFKEIGEKYGPFDLTMLECGQYNDAWAGIHMLPEETAQAHLDLRGNILMPIHWGAFCLAMHPWTEPVERLLIKAKKLHIRVTTPHIGQRFSLNEELPTECWWEEHQS